MKGFEDGASPAASAQQIAGRELDALVAEKVFGAVWRKPEADELHSPGCTHVLVRDNGSWLAERYVTQPTRFFWTEPYSTDISAAWTVVEKIGELGFRLSRSVYPVDGGEEWVCGWGDEHSWPEQGWGETAPLAICRAALALSRSDSDATPRCMDCGGLSSNGERET